MTTKEPQMHEEQERLTRVRAALATPIAAQPAAAVAVRPLPETMSRDEMLQHYSAHANLLAHEALQYQKRIRDLESTAQAAAVPEAVERDAARYRWLRSYCSAIDWNRLGHYGEVELDAQIDRLAGGGKP